MNFAKKIQDIRIYTNLTNSALEKKLNLSNGYISNIEKNGTDNPGKLLVALNKIGISADWFLLDQGDMLLSSEKLTKQPAAQKTFRETSQQVNHSKEPASPDILDGIEALARHATALKFEEQDKRFEAIEHEQVQLKVALEQLLKQQSKTPPLEAAEHVRDAEPEYDAACPDDECIDLPLAEGLAAGMPIEACDIRESFSVPQKYLKKGRRYCVAKIKGTSMTEVGIADGSHVLLEYTNQADSGAIAVVTHEGYTTLKRLAQKDNGSWELRYEDGSGALIPLKEGCWQVSGVFVRVLV